MATTHAPGTGFGPGDAGNRHRRIVTIGATVVAACAAIGIPFAVGGGDHDHLRSSAPPPTAPSGSTTHHSHGSSSSVATLGPHGDLPALLAAGQPTLRAGARVLIGDVTTGALAHAPGTGWQVVVRWDARRQALAMHGAVSLADPSWVSASGLLYTRVPTSVAGRFHVYAWLPQGGSAYTPPALVATDLGAICFDRTFTAFGNCHVAG